MKGVYECEVIAQSQVTPGVMRTILAGPEIARESRAGQFVNVQVARTTDPLLRRPFSVHAVYPEEGIYSLLYTMVGRGTAILSKIQPGEKLSVVGPLGRPFDLGEAPEAEHIVVAGGCGAAPLHLLCDELCRQWGCANVTVLSGTRSKDALLCEAEFRAHGVDVGISTDDGTYGYHGVVTQLLEESLAHRLQVTGYRLQETPSPLAGEGRGEGSASMVRVYSCGPHAMLREVARICAEHGVASCQVSLENNMACGLGVCMGCVQKLKGAAAGDSSGRDWRHERVCADGPVFNAEELIWE